MSLSTAIVMGWVCTLLGAVLGYLVMNVRLLRALNQASNVQRISEVLSPGEKEQSWYRLGYLDARLHLLKLLFP